MKDRFFEILRRFLSFDEKIRMKGRFVLELFGPDGGLKQRHEIDNLIVTAGKNALALYLTQDPPGAGAGRPFMKNLAIGTGTTAPAAGDTALQTEIGTRVTGSVSQVSGNIYQVQGTFAAGNGTGAIAEAGLFDAASAGTMFCRQTFSVVNKAAGDSLQITWQITLG